MALSCDTNALLQASACMRCIPRGAFDRVKTYLLCTFATNVQNAISNNPTNLINGASYSGLAHRYQYFSAVPGTTYRIVWGANDKTMDTGTPTNFQPTPGSQSFVVAQSSTLSFYGYSNGPVTAQLFLAFLE